MTDEADFYRAVPPTVWPPPPKRLSHSAIADIETCPRRWALAHSEYPLLWSGKGYPHRPNLGTLSGRVAHLALERISRAVSEADDPTFAGAAIHLRALGGISRVLAECASVEIARLDDNPRVRHRSAALESELARRIPELRLVVQSALNRVLAGAEASPATDRQGPSLRRALGIGYHSEVELTPDGMAWVGYADAIRLTEDACEIIDYKTGEPSPSHDDQVRLYALLWARDSVVNPTSRLATRLVLVYPRTVREVDPPTLADLQTLERQMRDRAAAAEVELLHSPPKAKVTPDGCKFCDVKQLCQEYWTSRSQSHLAVLPEPWARSLQGVITGQRGNSVTLMAVEFDPYLPRGTEVVVTRLEGNARVPGQRLRLVDVRVRDDPDAGGAVVSLGPQSEVFVVPSST